VETRQIEADGLKLDTPITLEHPDIRLDKMLDRVFRMVGVDFYVDDGTIVISSREEVHTRLEMRAYDCRDLMDLPRRKGQAPFAPRAGGHFGPAREPAAAQASGGNSAGTVGAAAAAADGTAPVPDGDLEFMQLLQDSIKPDSWNEAGGPGTVAEYRGLLIVYQTGPAHREMAEFLMKLRQAVASQSGSTKAK
jgi:hypothetical protein